MTLEGGDVCVCFIHFLERCGAFPTTIGARQTTTTSARYFLGFAGWLCLPLLKRLRQRRFLPFLGGREGKERSFFFALSPFFLRPLLTDDLVLRLLVL